MSKQLVSNKKLIRIVTNLPPSPGVYIYKDSQGKIIYVGKAINLKKRVSQYFQRQDALGPKTQTLVSQIVDIDYKTVDSEIEALILESSLIKKHHPKYNSLLKDDKSYLYICVSKENIPRIFTAYGSNLPPNHHLYGPFPGGASVKSLLKTIRRIFPFRGRQNHPQNPCFYCHLKLCPGPNPDPILYRQQIGKIKKILSGHFPSLQHQLQKEMKLASKDENYELALSLKQQLDSVVYVVSGWHHLSSLFDKIELPSDTSSRAINELLTTLKPYFSSLAAINRIECYDISQLGDKYFVGAMTVWQSGRLNNSQYRKFKIRTKESPDDQFMIKEILWRRFNHPEWGTPDLIVVDGGKPQVSSAVSLNQGVVIVGLAKKLETIVIKAGNDWHEINLPPTSDALKLLQSLRDEAHRFANRYRRQLISHSFHEN